MTDLVRTIREALQKGCKCLYGIECNLHRNAPQLLSEAAEEIERLEQLNIDLIKKVEIWVAGCAIAEKETP